MNGKQIVTDKWATLLAMFVLSYWPLKILMEEDGLFANACNMLPRLNLLCLFIAGQMEFWLSNIALAFQKSSIDITCTARVFCWLCPLLSSPSQLIVC